MFQESQAFYWWISFLTSFFLWLLQEAKWHPRHRQWCKKGRSALLLVSPWRSASLLSAHSRGGPPDHSKSLVQVHCPDNLHHWDPQLAGHRFSHQNIAPVFCEYSNHTLHCKHPCTNCAFQIDSLCSLMKLTFTPSIL